MGKCKYTLKFKKIAVWLFTAIFSLIFIFSCRAHFHSKNNLFSIEGQYVERAVIVDMGEYVSDSYEYGDDLSYDSALQYFTARLTGGERKDTLVIAVQSFDNYTNINEEAASVGDKVILYNYGTKVGGAEWIFGGYSRLDYMIVFAAAFCILLIVFGRIKGFNTIIALLFTCLAVFYVFLPAVISGANVYLWTSIICLYIIPMTLLITEGPTQKALTTILGCASGVLMAAILSLLFCKIMRLTGIIDEHSVYISNFDPPISLKGLIFAMVVIGSMGAVMDVAMDISSALHEIHKKLPDLSIKELWQSGLTIGRDVMGTMANTLVLAYIGSSLCSVILMISYSASLRELLNREGIIVEIMNGLIGSCAILLTIPLTSLICALIYKKETKFETPA